MALNAYKNEGEIHGANPHGQNTVLSWNFTKLVVSVCRTEMLVMLCLAYTDTRLPVLRFRKEDTPGGFLITKPKLSANCNGPLNFSRANYFLCSDLSLLLGQAHGRYCYSEILWLPEFGKSKLSFYSH